MKSNHDDLPNNLYPDVAEYFTGYMKKIVFTPDEVWTILTCLATVFHSPTTDSRLKPQIAALADRLTREAPDTQTVALYNHLRSQFHLKGQ